jgi:DNA repair exonuclease SbcCD nuclease subunit
VRTLLHVSDVHFGPRHLPEVARGVLDLVAARRPDAVVISGDLTQRAKPSQFRAARAFVAALPAPVAFVPGNHDVPLYRFWERALLPFAAWRRHFDRELVRDVVIDGLAVLGVNTAHPWTTKHGRLRTGDLEALRARLARVPPTAHRVVVAHHPVAVSPRLGREPVARGSGRLLELLRAHGVGLVLCGHVHHGFLVAPSAAVAGDPAVLHCGTSTSSRGRGAERGLNTLNWIELGTARAAVERRLWSSGRRAFEAVERFELALPATAPISPAPPGAAGYHRQP